MVLLGGVQEYWAVPLEPTPTAIELAWGNSSFGGQRMDLGIDTLAEHDPWGCGLSRMIVPGVPAAPATTGPTWSIVGAHQQVRDLHSKDPFVVTLEWGDTGARQQDIGVGQGYSRQYGWGFALYTLFLREIA